MTLAELKALFLHEQARFASVYPAVGATGFGVSRASCTPGSPCRARDLAWYDRRERTVWLLDRARQRPRRTLVALIRHELGHAADPWPDKPHAEARADRIAEQVTGQKIRYDAEGLQTTGPGGPRPRGLHR